MWQSTTKLLVLMSRDGKAMAGLSLNNTNYANSINKTPYYRVTVTP